MIPTELQQQINSLCDSHPPAKSVIDALIAHFDGPQNATVNTAPSDSIQYEDMSLILPQRRKCTLNIHDKGIWLIANDSVVLESSWSDITRCVCLPVLDKPKPTWNLIFSKQDPKLTIVLAVGQFSADKFKKDAKPGPLTQSLIGDVELHSSLTVETEYDFAVTAYVGSKEGTLYFLDDALVHGHKKPILILPLENISSFSFTVITRLTFNVVVKLTDDTSYEFSMIDEAKYPQIADYVSAHDLVDESLAADRAAKRARPEDPEDPSSLAGAANEAVHEDDDDRLSDLDVEFSDRELDSDGSGESDVSEDAQVDYADDNGVDLNNTSEINDDIDEVQQQQLEDQEEDEQDEEDGFIQMDSFDTNS